MIEFVEHEQIDKNWWDELNASSETPSFYHRAALLDIASPRWNALIDKQSGHAMPLTRRKKFGFEYLYQPFGIQQLGLIGPNAADQLQRFVNAIPNRYVLWNIAVAQHVELLDHNVEESVNCILHLAKPYEELRSAYSSNHKRNLKTLDPVVEHRSVEQFMRDYRSTSAITYGIAEKELDLLAELLNFMDDDGCLEIRGVQGSACASALIRWQNRIIFFKSCNDEAGRKLRAQFHLMDAVVRENAGSGMLIDFAGSNNPNTQRFYKGFGAEPHIYLRLKYNALPYPFRFLKNNP